MSSVSNAAFVSPVVAITPEMEAFFVALLLDHGTAPSPEQYGFERHKISTEIAKLIDGHPACPPITLKIKQSIKELGGKVTGRQSVSRDSDDWVYFTLKLADAYLDWLYAAGRLREARGF
jgi:hypothetical protein